MEPLVKHTGKVALMDRVNVDTDQIIPKQFLKRIERTGFGQFLFYDWRFREDGSPNPDFELNQPQYEGATILAAKHNFGCGSSREHAAWALGDYGFRIILAPSFADIFYNNCFKNGLLPIVLPEAAIEEVFRHGQNGPVEVTVDLEAKTVSTGDGWQVSFEIDDHRRHNLLHGLDDIGITLQYEDAIAAFERRRTG
ncbi:3-isopropylmalate dehydratase small subunit [Alicyclobacillus cycloheptanicus]|uniref:3-isopropylmalate dehydratase small subunit n=1 Tax=Alicyclobacillus cycloheptanicus TaxID=1457 RepID=A0ABT9XFW1_9BACL|nr:3-isopropylmalate dehydratase small subunit [Alicyclobacillus cycloheptanicus]MDQ0188959.1 3-isopropylmalate/(R)-2-methylmalate dehydratase small subunit [Alicyclobacillus cycloheptanicus]WDM01692.1 3-isopropylmalate dehydratase small subunit [Alicyclobacillus cycloheptanicus]